tara:strand:+ start:163 stop:321 length:159 start_codon:yes stop_codon:yes gene_type:complete
MFSNLITTKESLMTKAQKRLKRAKNKKKNLNVQRSHQQYKESPKRPKERSHS